MFSSKNVRFANKIIVTPANHVILMRFEGTNGSSSFVNEGTGSAWSNTSGSSVLTTANKKFGSSCVSLNMSNISSAANAKNYIGSQDFTMECWVNPQCTNIRSGAGNIFGGDSNNFGFWNALKSPATRAPGFQLAGWSWYSPPNIVCSLMPAGTWCHLAATRKGTSIYVHQDGVLKGQITVAANYIMESTTNASTPIFQCGANYGWTGYDNANYLIDEVHLQVGSAKYTTADFTPTQLP